MVVCLLKATSYSEFLYFGRLLYRTNLWVGSALGLTLWGMIT